MTPIAPILLSVLTVVFSQSFATEIQVKRPLTFTSYNIRNFGSKTNTHVLKNVLKNTNSDLIGIQEIKDANAFKNFIKNQMPDYKVALSRCGGGGKQKLGFLYNAKRLTLLSSREDSRVKTDKGCNSGLRPLYVSKFWDASNGITLTGIVVHLKAGGRASNISRRHAQLNVLSGLMYEYLKKDPNIVLLGDFNTTEYVKRGEYYGKFIDFIDRHRFIDFAAYVDCTAYWWGGVDDGLEYPSVLDHVLVSENLWNMFSDQTAKLGSHCARVSCRQRSADILGTTYKEVSDHCPVQAKLR